VVVVAERWREECNEMQEMCNYMDDLIRICSAGLMIVASALLSCF
jgi:hypothetical protein